MARRATGWTCQKQTKGKVCKFHNPPRSRKCERCGKARPVKRRAAHMAALDLDYAGFIKLNGGEFCGICGRRPSAKRKLDRDHDHGRAFGRGLLCNKCNRLLARDVTTTWLKSALKYLLRAEQIYASSRSDR